jgi:glycosyltransferase involved in cell wall biosynthesis
LIQNPLYNMDNISKGGSDIQYKYFQTHVNKELQNNIQIHRIPNPASESFYHIDGFLDQTKINVAWTQQSYDMIESLNIVNQQEYLDQIVCVSDWQKRMYIEKLNASAKNLSVIPNGIIPASCHKKPKQTCNLIFMSTPYRGLDVLLQAFQSIDNAHLHVFSSMKIYGQKDDQYQYLYDFCRRHPKITYYGYVPHSELLAALSEMHILAYPSTFEETSCISLLEALSAQLSVVCPRYGALEETASGFANMYDYIHNKIDHANAFVKHLQREINRYDQDNHSEQKKVIDRRHDWRSTIKAKWETLLRQTIDNKVPKTNLYYG